jgi:Na+/proline symporter
MRVLRGGRSVSAAAVIVCVLIAFDASACTVCFGSPDDPMVKGVNNGIWVLLGLVAFVQIGFVAMFWSFWRRARDQRRFREGLRVIEGGPHS